MKRWRQAGDVAAVGVDHWPGISFAKHGRVVFASKAQRHRAGKQKYRMLFGLAKMQWGGDC
jgi:hypothetical protein